MAKFVPYIEPDKGKKFVPYIPEKKQTFVPYKPDITRQQYYRDSYNDNVPNWLRSIDQGMISLNNWASKRPFQSDLASKIKNPVGSFAVSIPESLWNLPGRGIEQLRGYGSDNNPEYLAKRGADAAQLGLELAAWTSGGKAVKNLAQAGMKKSAPSILQLMKEGAIKEAIPGAGYGAGFGATSAIIDDKPILPSTLAGAGTGLLFGASAGGLMPAIGSGVRKVMPKIADRIAPLTESEIAAGGKKDTYIHPTTGKEIKRGTLPALEDFRNPKNGEIDVERFANETLKMAKAETDPNPGFIKKYFTSGGSILDNMGTIGKAVRKVVEEKELRVSQLRSTWANTLRDVVKPLNKESASRVWRALEKPMWKGALNENESVAFAALDKIRKTIYKWGSEGKLNLLDKQGNPIKWSSINPDEYVPHYYSEKVLNSGDFKARYIKGLLDSGDAKSPLEAELLFKQWQERNPSAKSHSLEHQRKLDIPGYIDDPFTAFSLYTRDVSRRIPEVDLFGKNREKLDVLLNALVEQGHDVGMVNRILDDMGGINMPTNKFVKAVTSFNTVTKISLGFFINATQQANTIESAGFKAWAKTYKDWLLHPEKREYMRDIAVAADAFEEMIMKSENGLEPGWLTDKALWLFKKSEELNRWNAANAGANRVKQLASQSGTAVGREQAKIARALDRLGIDMDKVLTEGINAKDIERAAYNMVNNTQFKINSLTLPPSWRTDWGRLLTQFKSFSFMQTKFIRDEIISEAGHGNIGPLLRYLMAAPISYWVADTLRNQFTQKKQYENPDATPEEIEAQGQKDAMNFLLKATGSLPADIISNATYVDEQMGNEYKSDLDKALVLAGNVGGPGISLGTNLMGAAIQSAQIDRENKLERPENQISPYAYPYGKMLTGMIPYVGPTLKNVMFPQFPKRARVEFKDSLKAAIKAGDMTTARQILSSNDTLRNREVFKEVIKEVNSENNPNQAIYDNLRQRKTDLKYLPINK